MDMCDPRCCAGVVDTQYAYRVCRSPAPFSPDVQQPPGCVECDVIPLRGPPARWISSHSTGGAGRIGFGHTFRMAELNNLEHVDVLIVGAGLSGVGAGGPLTMSSPRKSFAILESRGTIGGPWDLFRYPGIRSDPDMYTLGFS